MSYPKWRHHPIHESMIVWDQSQEDSWAPSSNGWKDDRHFGDAPVVDTPRPKNKGGRPRKEARA